MEKIVYSIDDIETNMILDNCFSVGNRIQKFLFLRKLNEDGYNGTAAFKASIKSGSHLLKSINQLKGAFCCFFVSSSYDEKAEYTYTGIYYIHDINFEEMTIQKIGDFAPEGNRIFQTKVNPRKYDLTHESGMYIYFFTAEQLFAND